MKRKSNREYTEWRRELAHLTVFKDLASLLKSYEQMQKAKSPRESEIYFQMCVVLAKMQHQFKRTPDVLWSSLMRDLGSERFSDFRRRSDAINIGRMVLSQDSKVRKLHDRFSRVHLLYLKDRSDIIQDTIWRRELQTNKNLRPSRLGVREFQRYCKQVSDELRCPLNRTKRSEAWTFNTGDVFKRTYESEFRMLLTKFIHLYRRLNSDDSIKNATAKDKMKLGHHINALENLSNVMAPIYWRSINVKDLGGANETR